MTVVQFIEAAIAAAPSIYETAAKAVALVRALFTSGAITKLQQDALMQHVNAVVAAHLQGEIPPHWTVEADPA